MKQKRLNGEILGRLIVDFPEQTPIDRTTLNAWEDPRISDWVEQTAKRKLEIAGLWTEACHHACAFGTHRRLRGLFPHRRVR
jgi:nicotinamidase-related amidase